jgi:tRNA A37 threonylcarbamoyladenosine synthetase subunit TsaC/SUA5/YrdC
MKTLLNTEKTLHLHRKEIGIRIPDNPVPLSLIKKLGFPLYSITAKRTMLQDAEFTDDVESEELLFEAGWELEDIRGVDLILDSGEEQGHILSTVLDISGDEVTLLRAGAGAWPA